jgi:hypothetical protein
MKQLFGVWNTENIKVVRRVIVSVIGVTVLLIGVASWSCRDPRSSLFLWGWLFLPANTPGHGVGLKKFAEWRATLFPVASARVPKILAFSFTLVIPKG